jgi:hypothetical protein
LVDRKLYFSLRYAGADAGYSGRSAASNRSRLEQVPRYALCATRDERGGTATELGYNASGSLVKEATGDDVTYFVWTADEMLDRVQLPDGS